jgi:hypothetical protein
MKEIFLKISCTNRFLYLCSNFVKNEKKAGSVEITKAGERFRFVWFLVQGVCNTPQKQRASFQVPFAFYAFYNNYNMLNGYRNGVSYNS